ncbi:peroxisome biogenesis factor 10-like [Asterias rubens]|uniref:peroxisome biogenesis factor 10-like n=1 Tax=Asterias rubens TaxID=7604 RepID=UPI0014550812|nr:peroxisome biogenesis factor 10-like [Asterias rubens]XP_033642255.1 peroxisome biogenesis factor 10-like [Asterias rubens]
MFQPASQPEIIRSNQKDQFYVDFLRNSLADICQSLAGPRVWARWRKELDVLGEVLYFGLTTVAGYQTLGEEYVSILQVDHAQRAVPNIKRRLALVLMYSCSPYLLDRLLAYIPKLLETDRAAERISPERRQRISKMIPVLRHAVAIIQRTHMALFYLRGVFYHLAKRWTGIQYLLVRRGPGYGSMKPSFKVLAWLSLIQLTASLLHSLYKIKAGQGTVTTGTETTSESDLKRVVEDGRGTNPALRCPLCLETRRNSTATPCGHLFCWECITEWCATKAECPLCREKFQLSRLIYLQNFDSR